MFSSTKLLIAGGLAFLAVVCAGLWFHNRTLLLNKLTQAGYNLKLRTVDSQAYSLMIADYEKRLQTLRADSKNITDKFAGKDYEAPQLVHAIVKAASLSGLEMTNASKLDKKTKAVSIKDNGFTVLVLSHAITLKGSYPGLVKFLQNIASWNIGYKIEAMQVVSANEEKAGNAIEVSLVLSVFMLEQPLAQPRKTKP